MHSVWFSRDFIGVVSFLRARRSGKTQKHLHNNKLCGYFFQARSKLHRFSKYFHSRYQALAINVDTFFISRSIYVGVRVEFFCVSIWHRQFWSTFMDGGDVRKNSDHILGKVAKQIIDWKCFRAARSLFFSKITRAILQKYWCYLTLITFRGKLSSIVKSEWYIICLQNKSK